MSLKDHRYIIFGAPGSGKSTLIKQLAEPSNCIAFDLETVGGKEIYTQAEHLQIEKKKRTQELDRLLSFDFDRPLFIGAADIDPYKYKELKIILLHIPHRQSYLNWIEKRNILQPEKRDQANEHMHQICSDRAAEKKYTYLIDPSNFADRPDLMAAHVWHLIDPDNALRPRNNIS